MDSSQFDLSSLNDAQRAELEKRLKNMSPEELAQLQAQQCIFCQIIAGKIEAKRLYEDEYSLVILDINPAAPGHLLVLPKQHFSILPQLPDNLVAHLFLVSKAVSQVLLKAIRGTGGTNILIANGLAAGQRAQHFMIHVIPRKDDDTIFSFKEDITELAKREEFAAQIKSEFDILLGRKVASSTSSSSNTEAQQTLTSPANQGPQNEATSKKVPKGINLDTVGKVVNIASDAISAAKEGAELLGLREDQIILKESDDTSIDEDIAQSNSSVASKKKNVVKKKATKKKTKKAAKKTDDLADLL